VASVKNTNKRTPEEEKLYAEVQEAKERVKSNRVDARSTHAALKDLLEGERQASDAEILTLAREYETAYRAVLRLTAEAAILEDKYRELRSGRST